MTGTTAPQQSKDATTDLPRPHRESRWRWSRPRQAMVAGGALAAVLGLGVATGFEGTAGAVTASSENSGSAAAGRPPGGLARPTVAGRVTALSGDTVTIETNAKASVTVITSSSTAYKTSPGPNGGTSTSASALKVGVFAGVQGTKNSDGTVTATSVVIGRPPPMGPGGGGSRRGSGAPPSGTSPTGVPSA